MGLGEFGRFKFKEWILEVELEVRPLREWNV